MVAPTGIERGSAHYGECLESLHMPAHCTLHSLMGRQKPIFSRLGQCKSCPFSYQFPRFYAPSLFLHLLFGFDTWRAKVDFGRPCFHGVTLRGANAVNMSWSRLLHALPNCRRATSAMWIPLLSRSKQGQQFEIGRATENTV